MSTHLRGALPYTNSNAPSIVFRRILFPCLLSYPLAALTQPDTDVHLCTLRRGGDNLSVTHSELRLESIYVYIDVKDAS